MKESCPTLSDPMDCSIPGSSIHGIFQARVLDKLLLNEDKIRQDLQQNYAVVAEAIQTILRREQIEGAYELLKGLTRTNKHIDKAAIDEFIKGLPVSEKIKAELAAITPENYTGYNY